MDWRSARGARPREFAPGLTQFEKRTCATVSVLDRGYRLKVRWSKNRIALLFEGSRRTIKVMPRSESRPRWKPGSPITYGIWRNYWPKFSRPCKTDRYGHPSLLRIQAARVATPNMPNPAHSCPHVRRFRQSPRTSASCPMHRQRAHQHSCVLTSFRCFTANATVRHYLIEDD
jgi:hypothetical protein